MVLPTIEPAVTRAARCTRDCRRRRAAVGPIDERHHVALHRTNGDGPAIAFELAGPRAERVDHGSGLDAALVGSNRDQAVVLDFETAQRGVFANLNAATQRQALRRASISRRLSTR